MPISVRRICGSPVKAVLPILLALASVLVSAGQNTPAIDSKTIFERTKAATVVILSGEGAGRLTAISTGVMISPAGVLLTAFHAIKGANEVQIRLPNGEVFDHVEMLGVDDRRDVAALRISAGALPGLPIGSTTNLAQGDPVYAVTNGGGLVWSATEGILSAIRSADDIPGIGSGFRLLQFSPPIAPGSSGGALVDRSGNLIGIITRGNASAGFAVPIESVLGLAESGQHTLLGSGRSLQLPTRLARQTPSSSAEVADLDHKKILNEARTIHIVSSTQFITASTLSRALALQKDWPKLGLTVVEDRRVADISLDVDRVIFTHVHTYSLVDTKTSIVLFSGRVRAFDGILASAGVAEEVVKYFSSQRLTKAVDK
jgi:hypothetical protein